MPTPREGESRDDWMNRCIPYLINEGREQDEAVATCSSMWENRNFIESIELDDGLEIEIED